MRRPFEKILPCRDRLRYLALQGVKTFATVRCIRRRAPSLDPHLAVQCQSVQCAASIGSAGHAFFDVAANESKKTKGGGHEGMSPDGCWDEACSRRFAGSFTVLPARTSLPFKRHDLNRHSGLALKHSKLPPNRTHSRQLMQ